MAERRMLYVFTVFACLVTAGFALLHADYRLQVVEAGRSNNIITCSNSRHELITLLKATEEDEDEVSKRVNRATSYRVEGVVVRQDGEARFLTWSPVSASVRVPVTKYNIYRTFETNAPLDIARLTPITSVNSSKPTNWKDNCSTTKVVVRYAVTAVDLTGTEHTADVVWSDILPLVGAFAPATPIRNLVSATNTCCVVCHDVAFNPDLNEFVVVYDCDTNSDGYGNQVILARLDSSGNHLQSPIDITTLETDTSVEGCPKIAYNPRYKQYLVSHLFRGTRIHSNRLVIVSRVIVSGLIQELPNPILSATGYNERRQPTDIKRLSSIVYNPITNGYVVAFELTNSRGVTEILAVYLDKSGNSHLARSIFSYFANVKQPNVVYNPYTKSLVFVSQLENFGTMPDGKDALLLRTEPASGISENNDVPTFGRLVRFTSVRDSSISLHRDSVGDCLRACYFVTNDQRQTVPSCLKLCETKSGGWNFRDDHVSFRTCKTTVMNPIVIEYPLNGAVFAVWEERDANTNRHRLQGYHVNTIHFDQDPLAANETNPFAVYKPRDGQVCVSWRHHSSTNTCSKLAFRCFTLSQVCDDPCSCPGNISNCDSCSWQTCDSNAECTEAKQCQCRRALGYVGNGTYCRFDPCTPELRSCSESENCVSNGKSFTCTCKSGYQRVGTSCLFVDPCAPGAHDCNINAYCQRSQGLVYKCHCYRGFIGDGKVCIDARQCDSNANRNDGRCTCNRGYVGNGAFCCKASFKDKIVTIGKSINLVLDTSCLSQYLKFTRFQWFHKGDSSPIDTISRNSKYSLNRRGTVLRIRNIGSNQLGQYSVQFHVGNDGPYVVTARVDVAMPHKKCDCGRSGKLSTRIASGGKNVSAGEYPWLAMLCGTSGVFCGGVMISKCCILTAAHCVTGGKARAQFNTKNSKSLSVCLGRTCGDCNEGVYDPKNKTNALKAQCFKAHKIKTHPGYNESTLENDIAVIQLKSGKCIKCVSAVASPVCLPLKTRDARYLNPGQNAWVSGWGEVNRNIRSSHCLRKGRTQIVEHDRCRSYYALQTPFTISNDQLCARDENGPCSGDSGGPLVVKNPRFDNKFVLAGLVSSGVGCGRNDTYGVYADVSHFLDWIYSTCSDYR